MILWILDIHQMSSVLTSVTLDVAVDCKSSKYSYFSDSNNLKQTIQALFSEWVQTTL